MGLTLPSLEVDRNSLSNSNRIPIGRSNLLLERGVYSCLIFGKEWSASLHPPRREAYLGDTGRTQTIGHLRSDQSGWWPIVVVSTSREI